MSCASPFEYVAGEIYETIPYNISFAGSVTVPGYSIPSTPLCMLGWTPAHCDWVQQCGPGCVCGWKWCKCCTQVAHCDWVKGSHYWYDCWNTPAIPLWPTLNIRASFTMPIEFELGAGYVIEVTYQGPIETTSITFEGFDLGFSVNGQGFTIPVPLTLTISQSNGQFSATIPLITFSEAYSEDGIDFAITMALSLVACATPEAGVGWLNIQIGVSFTASVVGLPSYSTSFNVMCPITEAVQDIPEPPPPDGG
jgi:hypothetical protein